MGQHSFGHMSIRKPIFPAAWPFLANAFTRADPTSDPEFYSTPRFVTHIDDRCIGALTDYYGRELLSPRADVEEGQAYRILDLCSSWISHLPSSFRPPAAYVYGVGLNKKELENNPALSSHSVHDLNASPVLPSECMGDFDAVICSVSIDYLDKPREVMGALARAMKPGAWAHMAFSNRCFPTKVVSRWLNISEYERCDQVAHYFHFAGTTEEPPRQPGELFEEIEIVTLLEPTYQGDPLWVVRGRRS